MQLVFLKASLGQRSNRYFCDIQIHVCVEMLKNTRGSTICFDLMSGSEIRST